MGNPRPHPRSCISWDGVLIGCRDEGGGEGAFPGPPRLIYIHMHDELNYYVLFRVALNPRSFEIFPLITSSFSFEMVELRILRG